MTPRTPCRPWGLGGGVWKFHSTIIWIVPTLKCRTSSMSFVYVSSTNLMHGLSTMFGYNGTIPHLTHNILFLWKLPFGQAISRHIIPSTPFGWRGWSNEPSLGWSKLCFCGSTHLHVCQTLVSGLGEFHSTARTWLEVILLIPSPPQEVIHSPLPLKGLLLFAHGWIPHGCHHGIWNSSRFAILKLHMRAQIFPWAFHTFPR